MAAEAGGDGERAFSRLEGDGLVEVRVMEPEVSQFFGCEEGEVSLGKALA